MDKITKISIERHEYLDEVGIKHGFWTAIVFYEDKSYKRMTGPFDNPLQALQYIESYIYSELILGPHHFPSRTPKHVNCRCYLKEIK